jgi:hypothetical protein
MDTENQLRHRLRALPVPPPAPGFAERVLAIARTADPAPWQPSRPIYALAASVALAVGVGIGAGLTQLDRQVAHELPVAMLAPGQAKQVRLMFSSPQDMAGVTVHLQLPDGVELVGYSGRKELRWEVDLQAGANALDLPMVLRSGAGGVFTTSLSHGQDHRKFEVLVRSQGI